MSTLQKMLDHRRKQTKKDPKEVKVELNLAEITDEETAKKPTKKKK